MNTNQNTKENLEEEFKTFINNIDKRNVVVLEESFHDQYLDHVIIKGMEDIFVSNKEKYLKSLEEGKIGGVEREVKIHSIEIKENFGIVKADLDSKVMNFQTQYTFLNQLGKWKVIHALVSAKKI
ncbi:nuclear transport factor 2 family protein [Leptospira sp. WS39.C2]